MRSARIVQSFLVERVESGKKAFTHQHFLTVSFVKQYLSVFFLCENSASMVRFLMSVRDRRSRTRNVLSFQSSFQHLLLIVLHLSSLILLKHFILTFLCYKLVLKKFFAFLLSCFLSFFPNCP